MAKISKNKAQGMALKRIRRRLDWSQEAAAEIANISISTWRRYENGDRAPDDWSPILRALDSSREEMDYEIAQIEGGEPSAPRATPMTGMTERTQTAFTIPIWGRARAGTAGVHVYDEGEPEDYIDISAFFGSKTKVTRIAGESMTGYAESGALVAYDTDKWPRKGKGCVVETVDGELLIKLYMGESKGVLLLRELGPEERNFNIPMTKVKGVYAVRWREE